MPLHEKSKEEFKSMFLDLDCDDFEAVFKFFDKNENGKVEKREMLDIMVEALKTKDSAPKKA